MDGFKLLSWGIFMLMDVGLDEESGYVNVIAGILVRFLVVHLSQEEQSLAVA